MALVIPNAVIKDRIAVLDDTPNVTLANSGKMDRSIPTIPPTKAFTMIRMVNCFQFSLSPKVVVVNFAVFKIPAKLGYLGEVVCEVTHLTIINQGISSRYRCISSQSRRGGKIIAQDVTAANLNPEGVIVL